MIAIVKQLADMRQCITSTEAIGIMNSLIKGKEIEKEIQEYKKSLVMVPVNKDGSTLVSVGGVHSFVGMTISYVPRRGASFLSHVTLGVFTPTLQTCMTMSTLPWLTPGLQRSWTKQHG